VKKLNLALGMRF